MSDRKDKKGKKDKSSKSDSKSSPTVTPAKATPAPSTGPVPLHLLQRTVEEEIITKWNTRPFARFPIHKDIPRFVRMLRVVDESGQVLYKPDSDEVHNAATTRLLTTLAKALDPDNLEKLTKPLQSLPEKVDLDSMSSALHAMEDLDNVSSPALKLLKGLNQSILAPALVNLQLCFMNTKFMFSDISWNIEVRLFEEHVRIVHRRFENFTATTGHFGWDCSLVIRRRDMHIMSAKTRVFEFRIPDEAVQLEWTKLIHPIHEPDALTACSAIFGKAWDRLPIAKDLIRFATHTTFVLGPEASAIRDDKSGDSIAHLKDLLLKLSEIASDDEMKAKIDSTFDSGVGKQRSGDLNAVLRSYLSDTLEWTDETVLPRFCKFFTQSILAPLATNLQLALSGISPIKDGTVWTINVSLVPSGFVIRHTKEQMSLDRSDPTKCFDITWQAEFEIDHEVRKICSVQSRVVSVTLPLETQADGPEAAVKRKELTSLVNVLLM